MIPVATDDNLTTTFTVPQSFTQLYDGTNSKRKGHRPVSRSALLGFCTTLRTLPRVWLGLGLVTAFMRCGAKSRPDDHVQWSFVNVYFPANLERGCHIHNGTYLALSLTLTITLNLLTLILGIVVNMAFQGLPIFLPTDGQLVQT